MHWHSVLRLTNNRIVAKRTSKEIEALIKFIREKMDERTALIAQLEEVLKGRVISAESRLLDNILNDFIDKLSIDENGAVKNTNENKKLLRSIDKIFQQFNQVETDKLIKTLLDSVTKVVSFNKGYYTALTDNTPVAKIDEKVKQSLRDWIGLNPNGTPKKGAYLDALVKNPTVLASMKTFAFQAITSSRDFEKLKKDFRKLIVGDTANLGALQGYYRNYVYDSISQVDRAVSHQYSVELKFKHAIYEGGLIATSRDFCRQRNGKVFALSEILKFNPPTAKPQNYDPLTQGGGFGCRHHFNWIPYNIAKRLRPDVPIE